MPSSSMHRRIATATGSSPTRAGSRSSPGKHDGLYWKAGAGEPPSPLGPLAAAASSEGYRATKSGPTPYHGYYYRMLKGQAASAGGAAYDYVVGGRAIGGFAVVAYPAKYGNSGIMTFIVNQDGKVFQSDLGPGHRRQGEGDAAFRSRRGMESRFRAIAFPAASRNCR